jgi:hypothetical protein
VNTCSVVMLDSGHKIMLYTIAYSILVVFLVGHGIPFYIRRNIFRLLHITSQETTSMGFETWK